VEGTWKRESVKSNAAQSLSIVRHCFLLLNYDQFFRRRCQHFTTIFSNKQNILHTRPTYARKVNARFNTNGHILFQYFIFLNRKQWLFMNFQPDTMSCSGAGPVIIPRFNQVISHKLVNFSILHARFYICYTVIKGFKHNLLYFFHFLQRLPYGDRSGDICPVAFITSPKIDGDHFSFFYYFLRSSAMRQGRPYSGSDNRWEACRITSLFFYEAPQFFCNFKFCVALFDEFCDI